MIVYFKIRGKLSMIRCDKKTILVVEMLLDLKLINSVDLRLIRFLKEIKKFSVSHYQQFNIFTSKSMFRLKFAVKQIRFLKILHQNFVNQGKNIFVEMKNL